MKTVGITLSTLMSIAERLTNGDQDWEHESTLHTFKDESVLCVTGGQVNAFANTDDARADLANDPAHPKQPSGPGRGQGCRALSKAEVERLTLVIQELARASFDAATILQHGFEWRKSHTDATNRNLLAESLGRLAYAIDLMTDNEDVSREAILEGLRRKELTCVNSLRYQD